MQINNQMLVITSGKPNDMPSVDNDTLKAAIKKLQYAQLYDDCQFTKITAEHHLTLDILEILGVHDMQMIHFLRQSTDKEINLDSWNIALMSANTCYIAREYIQDNQKIYCLNVFAGYCAQRNQYQNNCFLNNAAICAKTLLLTPEVSVDNVGILDFVQSQADVFDYELIHVEQIIAFSNITKSEYLNLIDTAINNLLAKNIDVLIIPFGVINVKFDDYFDIGELISRKCVDIKIIITQEECNVDDISTVVYSFLTGINAN